MSTTIVSKKTGKNCTMYMEDDGSFVKFYIKSNSTTIVYPTVKCTYSAPKAKGSFNMKVPTDGSYVQVGPTIWGYVSGNVTWTIPKNSSEALGGPTTFTMKINRSGDVLAPKIVSLRAVSSTSVEVNFVWQGGGGELVRLYNIRYGKGRLSTNLFYKRASTSGKQVITGLSADTVYWFRMNAQNMKGKISEWGKLRGIQTSGGAYIYHNGEWINAKPFVKVNGAWKAAVVYVKHNGVWKKTA